MSDNEHWKLISLKLPIEMLNEWEIYSKARGLKRSEFIRSCVNNVIHPDENNLTDQIVKFYTSGLEKRLFTKLQRLEAILHATLSRK